MSLRVTRPAIAVAAATLLAGGAVSAGATGGGQADQGAPTTSPIQHLVVIFQENVSFDHYFSTYPKALNPSGEPSFTAKANTPAVNGFSDALLTANPNSANPHRLSRSQAHTCDMDHEYTDEQSAVDHGAMDRFVEETSDTGGSPPHPLTLGECTGGAPTPGNMAVMTTTTATR